MWRNIIFLNIYHAKKSEISPHDKFFSTCLAGDTGDKYEVCKEKGIFEFGNCPNPPHFDPQYLKNH